MKYERKITTFGFVNVNKPSGVTSSFVVNKIKRLTGQPCGHMGTLDPMANGVLPVGIGNATRLFDYFLQKKKKYVAEFLFGATSPTLDTTGDIEWGGRVPTREEIVKVLPRLVGEVMQMPPKYSAKSVDGKRGYDLARAGIDFTLAPKKVCIDDITLLDEERGEGKFLFSIDCGAGTYIRSIARDLGEALSTNCIMSGLTRSKSGIFQLSSATKLEDINEENIESLVIKTEDVLPFERVAYPENHRIFHGLAQKTALKEGLYKIYEGDVFYGIAQVQAGMIKVKTKLC